VSLEFPNEHATEGDDRDVLALLGRRPKAAFTVVVRDLAGSPVVIRNAPLQSDGTPMPTRYWLIGLAEIEAIGRIEAAGGVRAAQAALNADEIAQTHLRHGQRRNAELPVSWTGHRPTGGVAGTRTGVKCLHAHFACWLAGEDDIVGQWVADQLPASMTANRSS
jgi:uncharacterized protein